jgi:hypothetical protein
MRLLAAFGLWLIVPAEGLRLRLRTRLRGVCLSTFDS